jgi:hypothetical protein
MEHRWGERRALSRMVSLRAGRWCVLAQLKNISSSGAYLRCAVPDPAVSWIRIDFKDEHNSASVVAYVVRRTADGIGVEWGEFSPEFIARLLSRAEAVPAASANSYSTRRSLQAGRPPRLR